MTPPDTPEELDALDRRIAALQRLADFGDTLPDEAATQHVKDIRHTIAELEKQRSAAEARKAELAKEPDWICSGIPDKAVEAGIAAWNKANHDLANYISGVTPDWDEGMIVCAIYKAMAPLAPVAEPFDVEALARECLDVWNSDPDNYRAVDLVKAAIRETLKRILPEQKQ